MRIEWLIIDGYSLLHRDDEYKSLLSRNLSLAREAAIRDLNALAGMLADRVTVVFDGQGGRVEASQAAPDLEVVYSPGNLTADTCIERLVEGAPNPDLVLVVTSDRRERENVMAAGAQSMSCGEFLSWSRAHADRLRRRIDRKPGSASGRTTLGDYFPE